MSNMSLGGYTFDSNPSDINEIMIPIKRCASIETYTSAAFFSWGASLVGKKITFSWNYMTCDMFDSLNTLYQADASVVFNPQDGSSKTWNVEIISLTGKYHLGLTHDDNDWRSSVKMELLILSEVS